MVNKKLNVKIVLIMFTIIFNYILYFFKNCVTIPIIYSSNSYIYKQSLLLDYLFPILNICIFLFLLKMTKLINNLEELYKHKWLVTLSISGLYFITLINSKSDLLNLNDLFYNLKLTITIFLYSITIFLSIYLLKKYNNKFMNFLIHFAYTSVFNILGIIILIFLIPLFKNPEKIHYILLTIFFIILIKNILIIKFSEYIQKQKESLFYNVSSGIIEFLLCLYIILPELSKIENIFLSDNNLNLIQFNLFIVMTILNNKFMLFKKS